MNTVCVITYGCSANISESEIMAGILQQAGFQVVNDYKIADLIIVNSCIVKSVTQQKILSKIDEIIKSYPEKRIIIAGCAPEVIKENILDINSDINLVSTHQIKKIAQAAQKVLSGKHVELLGESNDVKLCLPRIRKNPVVGITVISSGCSGNCSYCTTRLAKGNLFSYPKNKIIEEISKSVEGGCKEVWLTSQDLGAYGIDEYNSTQLPALLEQINKIPGKFSVRLGMMNPNNIKPVLSELVDSMNNNKIYKFIHIPIQSGNNEILKDMNRLYDVKEFEEIFQAFRDAFRCTIWTDVIIGYPGETEEQFKDTINLIKRLEPDWVNVSRFAKRDGTPASKLKQLDTEEMKRRTTLVSNLVDNIALKKNKEWVDWEGEILITERGKKEGQWIGHNFAYKPVVINKSGDLLGKRIKVKIIDAIPTTLVGWPIKE